MIGAYVLRLLLLGTVISVGIALALASRGRTGWAWSAGISVVIVTCYAFFGGLRGSALGIYVTSLAAATGATSLVVRRLARARGMLLIPTIAGLVTFSTVWLLTAYLIHLVE